MKQKFLIRLLGGICGGVILGIFLFVTLMEYGGRYGCFPIVDRIFHDVGYLSCGSFGSLVGTVVGSLIGVIIFEFIKITEKNYSKIIKWIVGITIIIPFLYGIIYGTLRNSISEVVLLFAVIGGFIISSLFPSLIFTSILNWKIFQKKIN